MNSASTQQNEFSEYLNTDTLGLCPVCEHKPARLLYRVDCNEAARHFVNPNANPKRHASLSKHISSLWKQAHCEILRCRQCDFCYAYPYVAGDQQFYLQAFQGHSYPSEKWEFKRCREELAQVVARQPELRVLEIGAGHGLFAKMIAPSLLPKNQMLCLEYSNDGIQKIRDYGIDAQAQDVRTLQPERPFEVVCCFQVLEHLDRLDDLFDHLRKITTPDGRLFFSVPNPKRVEFNETHGALLDMPPNHIGRWNDQAFKAVCTRHGWRLDQFETEPQDSAVFTRQFAIYRVMRQQQTGGFIYSNLASPRNRMLRRVFQAPLLALEMIRATALRAELSDPALGDSLFVQLSKVS